MAVNRKAGRWSGKQARPGKAAGDAKARSDRKLQQEAETARARSEKKKPKKNGAVQVGQRAYPEPPVPEQQLAQAGARARPQAAPAVSRRPNTSDRASWRTRWP